MKTTEQEMSEESEIRSSPAQVSSHGVELP
jgi:hypothetical protein